MESRVIGILVDRSGSMMSMGDEVRTGLNQFVQEQRAIGEGKLVIHEFDDRTSCVYKGSIMGCPTFGQNHFVPRGMTALYDGINILLSDVEMICDGTLPIILIMTDGEENSSKEFKHAQTKARIVALQQKGWHFIFLGANEDAILTGSHLGIDQGTCLQYGATPESQYMALRCASSEVARARSGAECGFGTHERMATMPN